MKKPPPPIKRGEVITADFLNRLIRLEQALGWGSGSRAGGKIDAPGVQWFKAQENFTAFEDVYRGDAKLWWYKPSSNTYAVHNDAITVYSHADDVATGDVFAAAFNVQSGRWEKVSGSCACQEIHRFVTNGPTAGTFSVTYTVGGTDYTLTWDWDATAAEVGAEFGTESAALNSVSVYGGPWPAVALYVVWDDPPDDVKGIDNHPSVDNSSLTDGEGFFDKFSIA